MEPPGSGSGSGAAEPVEEERIQEPASNASSNGDGAPTAAAPPPPLHLEQAGGGADGSRPAAVVDLRKGKAIAAGPFPPPVSPSSAGSIPDSASAFGAGGSSSSAGRRMVVPRDTTLPFDYTRVFQQVVREGQSVIIEEGEEEQVESPHAKDAPPGKEKEKKLPQVKVRPRPEKGKSLWSRLKNKIFCREGRQICSEREEHQIFRREGKQIYSRHVEHQTRPINEVRNRYMVSSNEANHLDAYSEIRLVIGDGECFYRSFIFSYLEQVIDRQDTDEEHRLLHVVERMSVQHAILGWNSEFSRTSRAFEELIEKVMRWKGTESTSSCRKEELLQFFSTYERTQDIFAFLRLLVAIHICSHSEEYVPHIPEVDQGNCSLEVWCFEHVIPARVDADHVMLVALATALEVPLRTESFQQGYARDIYTGPGFPRPSVTLLYTGNHYNIIYPRAPSAESSSHQASKREEPAGQS
ncbi:OVARIAN TUMOR DOMAIN-containing deubiquitinating enzyme 1-like isoform X2 [Triticum urartu]|uniref:OVARIAN TUMOR DOMAIN-containing deubiquitinating enzyme 1-like isoform X2 n=1 Tax=Triticum urartu TaxID=4572 RepID=UPI0020447C30|nr:OVARIAN TUMOR DOMAIN-containing deubiquitinating enzyme 1-like isoform X2 [Triticum urartu]